MNLDGLASHKLGEEMLFTLIEVSGYVFLIEQVFIR